MDREFLPKELLEIDWREKVEDNDEFLNEEFIINHSATYKILNDAFTKVWSSDSEDDSKQNNPPKETPKISVHQLKKSKQKLPYKPFSGYPKASILTPTQQEVYLSLMKKFTNHSPFLSPQEQKELQTYTILQEKVNKEQLEYLQFLREYAFANQSRYLSIKPGIRKYINELWKSKLQIPLRYPQFYETYRTVPLVFGESKRLFELFPEEISLQLGTVPRLSLQNHRKEIRTDYSAFVAEHPISNDDSQAEASSSNLKKYPVSQDKNADHLAKLTNAEFIISSSGLKRICDNHAPLFQKSWELPVTVKEYDTEENGIKKTKRLIFIDKAFPKRKMTVVDKINWYHKIGLKSALVNPSRTSVFRLDKKRKMENSFAENTSENSSAETSTCMKATDVSNKVPEVKKVSENMDKNDKNISLEISYDDNSSNLSDSDDGNLVIEDVASNQQSKAISNPSKEVGSQKFKEISSSLKATVLSPKSSGSSNTPDKSIESEEGRKKPLTRSMAKMLENLNKVEKMIGKKGCDVANSSAVRKLIMVQNKELDSATSLEEASSKADQERKNDQEKDKQQPDTASTPDKKCRKKRIPTQSILDVLLDQQRKMLGSDQKKMDDQKSENKRLRSSLALTDFNPVPPPEGVNLVYRLFILRRKDPIPGIFRILVRCKYDAMQYIDKVRMATIVPKVEFQPEFGAEAVTLSELTRQWVSSLIKPNSSLIRGRIDAFTSRIIMLEQKEIKDFSREEKLHNTQASTCLNTLYSVLRGMCDIPPGQYLLSHDSKMGAFASLYRAVAVYRDGAYDLHKQYQIDSSLEESQNIANIWIPLDFGIITPYHEVWNRVPGTFNPLPKNNKKGKKSKKKR